MGEFNPDYNERQPAGGVPAGTSATGPARGDFGEPWGPMYHAPEGVYYTADRDGRAVFRMIDGPLIAFPTRRTSAEMEVVRVRVQTLVNLWAGVPTAELAARRQIAAGAEPLLALLRECRAALREHDADYRYATPPDLVRRLDEILGK